MNKKATNNSQRIFGLDIFRALAIFLVVSSHGGFLLNNTFLDSFPFIRMIDGVDLFFVLSGFLIGGILLKEINQNKKFGLKELSTFWKRRWFRTLPNYFLILLLNFIIVKYAIIHEDITQFNWKFLVFSQNLVSPFYGFFWESWSISIEEWFYLSTPILLLGFLKIFNQKKAFLLAIISMMFFPILYRYTILDPNMDDFWFDVTFRKVILARLDSISYGLLAAWVFFYYPIFWTKYKFHFLTIGIGLIIFIVNYPTSSNSFYKQIIYFTITPISAMLLLPFAESIKSGRGMIALGITHISKISYSMYLINLALVAKIFADNFVPTSQIDGILKYGLYWTIVIIASTILYQFFEKPMMNLRDKKIF